MYPLLRIKALVYICSRSFCVTKVDEFVLFIFLLISVYADNVNALFPGVLPKYMRVRGHNSQLFNAAGLYHKPKIVPCMLLAMASLSDRANLTLKAEIIVR